MTVFRYSARHEARTTELDRQALAVLGNAEEIERQSAPGWQETLLREGGELFLLEEDGLVVGMCGYLPEDDGAVRLKKFRIEAARQGSGRGRALLRFVEEEIRARGYSKIVLDTSVLREKTLVFYDRLGYARKGLRKVREIVLLDYEKVL